MNRLMKNFVLMYDDFRFVYTPYLGGKQLALNVYWTSVSHCTRSQSKGSRMLKLLMRHISVKPVFKSKTF